MNVNITKIAKKLSSQHKKTTFPYVKISSKDASSEFLKLKDLDCKKLISKSTKTEFANNFKYKGKKLFTIISSSIGNKISNKFFQKERMKASMANHPSPIQVWKDDNKRTRLFAGMIKLNKQSPTKNEAQLRASMRLYFSVVPQFKVAVAKCIYNHFDARNVLDFSSGWGDRLTAFLSCTHTKSYTGIDPNTKLEKCYNNLIKNFNSSKTVKMIYKPAETVLPTKKFDLIFTSPPYFELEKYSENKTQSNIKYSNLEDWFTNFLFKALKNNLRNLTGTLALQISDYKKGSKKITLVTPLLQFMSKEFPEFKYKGYICVSTKGRFNKSIVEPIFIWQNK